MIELQHHLGTLVMSIIVMSLACIWNDTIRSKIDAGEYELWFVPLVGVYMWIIAEILYWNIYIFFIMQW